MKDENVADEDKPFVFSDLSEARKTETSKLVKKWLLYAPLRKMASEIVAKQYELGTVEHHNENDDILLIDPSYDVGKE